MKILVTGSNGLLGQKLIQLLIGQPDIEVIATARGVNRLPAFESEYTYAEMDITNENQTMDVLKKYKPDSIINTAAMTNVDQCETNKDECWQLNVKAVEYLVRAVKVIDAHLVHLSTDFIFDGSRGPLDENEVPAPVNYYGESKLAAERLIEKSAISWSVARTVLVYGIALDMSRSNIILWVKNSLENKNEINVVDDQWRTPTLAEDLAMGCYLLAKGNVTGIYNISGKDMLTPYEMAIKTAKFFGLDQALIHQTDGSRFKQTAKRPPKTGFIIDKAKKDLGYDPHSFDQGLEVLKSQMKGQ